MNGMKYIVYDNGMYSAPVIFPSSEDHADFSRRLGIKREDIMSAGFVELGPDGLQAYGSSHSLGIRSDSERDTKLIKRMMGDDGG
mgnify:CR=1 FL=1